jgi:DNA-binding response OmpR family regulator
LLARIRAQLRRAHEYASRGTRNERYELDDIVVDVSRHEVLVRGRSATLTPKEFELLKMLVSHVDKAISREQLLQDIWHIGE